MCQRVNHLVVIVEKYYLDLYGVLWEGYEEYILIRLLYMLGLVGGEPLMEEGGEGVTVDDYAVGFRTDGDLPVASQWEFCQMLSTAIPVG
jgi:hypothetical protein